MSRKSRAVIREVPADARFDSRLIQRFINLVMRDGKKTIAETIVYEALAEAMKNLASAHEGAGNPVDLLTHAVDSVRPIWGVISRRVGGATLQVPYEIPYRKSVRMALEWMREGALSKAGSPMIKKLSAEIVSAFKKDGFAMKKKIELAKMAESNRVNAAP